MVLRSSTHAGIRGGGIDSWSLVGKSLKTRRRVLRLALSSIFASLRWGRLGVHSMVKTHRLWLRTVMSRHMNRRAQLRGTSLGRVVDIGSRRVAQDTLGDLLLRRHTRVGAIWPRDGSRIVTRGIWSRVRRLMLRT